MILSKTRLYNSWQNMKSRCNNPNNPKYSYYGGRGISVCKEWMKSFKAFKEDMGERPEGMTLDRIDNDKNYEPSNCKWSTWSEQMKNRRDKLKTRSKYRHVTYNNRGRTKRWVAHTGRICGTNTTLGYYMTEEEAHEAVIYAGDFIEKGYYPRKGAK